MILTYNSRIRVFVEENAPLWMFSISKILIQKIERLQRISFYIILGKKSKHEYSANMKELQSKSLEER